MAIPTTARPTLVTGDDPGSGASLRARPNERFFLVHYAEYDGAWEVDAVGLDRPRLLPAMTKSIEAAGVSGYRMLRTGDPPARAYSLAHSMIRERGGVVLAHNISVGGEVGYLARVPCNHRGASGFFHHEKWVSYRQPRPGKRPKPQMDRAAFNQWRAAFVDEGHVEPPSAGFLATMRRRLVATLSEVQNRQITNETARAEMVGAAQKRVADFDAAASPSEPKPAPKPRRRRTVKAKPKATGKSKATAKSKTPTRVDAPAVVNVE